ncbi:uncharacterized protein LOC112082223 isoform X2 [Eutrema salsugineum]|uniref:uncharacterized protein LOC112082223 isoform X2 n=1 Tax=Eutrema salsugineum TaxID=72664 RepID=UPI000CED0FE6|nr:uncharacterized protein LOC112082223 isoform X2 [Eutrema salsugineum]
MGILGFLSDVTVAETSSLKSPQLLQQWEEVLHMSYNLGRDHIWKWWDEAVEENFTILQIRIDQVSGRIDPFHRTELLQSYENRMYIMEPLIDRNTDDIGELKEVVVEIQQKVARMKEAMKLRGKAADTCLNRKNWYHLMPIL